MRRAASSVRSSLSTTQSLAISCAIFFIMGLATACGSGGSSPGGGQMLTGNTSVTVLLSSTANDQLSEFGLVFQGISLTSQSGQTANLLSTSQGAEFLTVNGGAIPLVTASIPQGIYTSASVTVGSAQFTCVTLGSDGDIAENTFAYGQTPAANVTVNIPTPITITGASMGISLDLLVAQSAAYTTCDASGIQPFSINPTFEVTSVAFSSEPTNPSNGKISGTGGAVTAIATSGNSLTLSMPVMGLFCQCWLQLPPLTINTDGSTAFQGINDFASLAEGSLLDLDGNVQPDGSLLATRIAAYDPSALNVMTGPLLILDAAEPTFYSLGLQQQGQTYGTHPQGLGVYSYSGNTSFEISGQFSNLANLPFPAAFNGSNMVSGQNIAIFSQQITDSNGGDYTAATTIALMPQTINGTVIGSTTSGNFTDYQISLAPYDLFPTLATQPGQTTVLNNPGIVDVYIDNSTQMLNTQQLAANGTFRFYGLVFNDNGALRMDCAQVNDGVTGSSQSNLRSHVEVGNTRVVTEAIGRHKITSVRRSQYTELQKPF
jgi:Domain of unknown function (DUF5666)